MRITSNSASNFIFHGLCILGTIGLSFNCLVKYIADEDTAQNAYKNYHDKDQENVYPSLSFCVINPFLEDKFKRYGYASNVTSYVDFLQGIYWDDEMLSIDYDKVTVPLEDALLGIRIKLHDNKEYIYDHIQKSSDPIGWIPNFLVSFNSSIRKCFSFDVPFMENKSVFEMNIVLRKTIFPNEIIPLDASNLKERGGLYVYFHLPGQRFTSYYTIKHNYDPKIETTQIPELAFKITDVEVMKRRNTRKNRCIDDWRSYDHLVMNDIMSFAVCCPPHWNTSKKMPRCSTAHQMKFFDDQPNLNDLKLLTPCRVIGNMIIEYLHYDGNWITTKYQGKTSLV